MKYFGTTYNSNGETVYVCSFSKSEIHTLKKLLGIYYSSLKSTRSVEEWQDKNIALTTIKSIDKIAKENGIRISKHAKIRMKEREITLEEVYNAWENKGEFKNFKEKDTHFIREGYKGNDIVMVFERENWLVTVWREPETFKEKISNKFKRLKTAWKK